MNGGLLALLRAGGPTAGGAGTDRGEGDLTKRRDSAIRSYFCIKYFFVFINSSDTCTVVVRELKIVLKGDIGSLANPLPGGGILSKAAG